MQLKKNFGSYTLELNINQKTQSIDGNYTDVSYLARVYKNDGSYGYWADDSNACSYNLWISGSKIKSSSSSYDFTGSSSFTIASGTYRVNHNLDGTKQMVYSVYWSDNINDLGSAKIEGSMELTTIPRASDFEIIKDYIGKTINIKINRKSSSFTHQVWWKFENGSWIDLGKGIYTSASFIVPKTEITKIPNSAHGELEVWIDTYNGSAKIGTKTKKINIFIDPEIIPTLSASYAILPGKVPQDWDVIVEGYSKIRINISANGVYGSTIKSYSVSGNNQSGGNGAEFGTFNKAGEVSFNCSVTDSRGKTAITVLTVTVIPYKPPSIVIEAERCLANGTKNKGGRFLLIKANYSYANILNKNIVTKSISCNGVTNTNFDSDTTFILAANLLPSELYDVIAEIRDNLGNSSTTSIKILTDVIPFHIGINKNMVGIGGYATEAETFKSYWKGVFPSLEVNGKTLEDIITSLMPKIDPEIIENSNGVAYKYPDGRLECEIAKQFTGQNLTKWGSMYYSSLGSWTYPVSFTDSPSIIITGSRYVIYTFSTGGTTTQSGNVIANTIDNSTNYDSFYKMKAIGRWK